MNTTLPGPWTRTHKVHQAPRAPSAKTQVTTSASHYPVYQAITAE
jgi:hypothetical protein